MNLKNSFEIKVAKASSGGMNIFANIEPVMTLPTTMNHRWLKSGSFPSQSHLSHENAEFEKLAFTMVMRRAVLKN